jgi:hypothetical protein
LPEGIHMWNMKSLAPTDQKLWLVMGNRTKNINRSSE